MAEWHLPFSDHVLLLQTEKAGRLAARHLCERGFRRFVYVPQGFPPQLTPGHREFGFCDELHKLGVSADAIRVAPIVEPDRAVGHSIDDLPGYRSARALIQSDWWTSARPERVGFYAANDVAAVQVLRALHESQIPVPGEAGVVGTNGTQLGQMVSPPLTSISLDVEAVAHEAVDRLLTFLQAGRDGRRSGSSDEGQGGPDREDPASARRHACQLHGEGGSKTGKDAPRLEPRLLVRGST